MFYKTIKPSLLHARHLHDMQGSVKMEYYFTKKVEKTHAKERILCSKINLEATPRAHTLFLRIFLAIS